ncbi:MAG: ATP-binding protein [Planctomycetaceae bacterium]|nr:ATP-binding protein [Planctomycetaceae bacterium]
MSLHAKISLGAAAAMLASVLVTLFLNMGMFRQETRQTVERELMDMASIVALFPEVRSGLRGLPSGGTIQALVQQILASSRSVDQITVCNMQRIRYSHSNPDFIGLVQEGDDVKEVLFQARRYVSPENIQLDDATGGFMRAYAPVFDGDEQLGFVIAGVRRERVVNASGQLTVSALVYGMAGLVVGLMGAMLLAHSANRNLHGLEPQEIIEVYARHDTLIEAMHEGVIAINNRGRITLVNASARRLLGLGDRVVDGMAIDSVMPDPRLPTVVATGEAEYGREKRIASRVFIANMVPVRERDRVVGAVETFQDRTQVVRMAEELTGIRQLVEALRASSHEFSNKLHVILGLLELAEYEQAKQYVQATQSSHGQLHTRMLRAFREPMLAGLMLGKFSVARERGVSLEVDEESQIGAVMPESLAHTLVLVLGNLIDNAMDAVRENRNRDGRIVVDIRERNDTIHLTVRDNGPGVPYDLREMIFVRGFSTKGDGRGTGLHLVKQEMEVRGGAVSVRTEFGETVFTVRLPKNGGRVE